MTLVAVGVLRFMNRSFAKIRLQFGNTIEHFG